MFRVSAEGLKKEIEEKIARLKELDCELKEIDPSKSQREKELKKWQKNWEAYARGKGLIKSNLQLKEEDNDIGKSLGFTRMGDPIDFTKWTFW